METTQIRNKRTIRAKKFEDCVSTNFVDRKQTLNKNSYKVPEAGSKLYKNSFFPPDNRRVEPAGEHLGRHCRGLQETDPCPTLDLARNQPTVAYMPESGFAM